MKLYYSPGACSLAPHIISQEIGLHLDLVQVDTHSHKLVNGADFFLINPKGYVPLLEMENGETLSEGPVICQYLANLAPDSSLLPVDGSLARYRVLEWQSYISSEIHKSFIPLFHPGVDASSKNIFAESLLKKFKWISENLSDQEYLTGNTFTIADAYLYAVTRWAAWVNLDLSGLDPLQAFMTRVTKRPAVERALRTEGLL